MTQTTAAATPQDMLRQAFQLFDQGKIHEAAKLAEALRQQAPNHPDVLHLMGLICLKTGNPKEAEKLIGMAVSILPDKAFLRVNLGNALRQLGKNADARAAYDKAEALDPDFAGTYLNRGTLHAEEGRADACIRDFEAVIRLMPNDPQGYLNLGQYQLAQGAFVEARDTYAAGLKARPDGPMLLLGLANSLERLGDLEGAFAAAEKVLQKMPDLPGALRIWSSVKRRQGSAEEARDRLERVSVAKLPPGGRRLIHGELAQVYDRLGEAADAFDHFVAQNDAAAEQLAESPIDKSSYMTQVTDLKAAFTSDWVQSWTQIAPDDLVPVPAPVFLVGFPRSGTTLLDQFLDAHSRIEVVEELPVLLPVRDAVKESGGYPEALADLSREKINELRRLYNSELSRAGFDPSAKTVINKLPLNIIHAGLISRIFPEAKFILALRHPADAVLSCFMQDFQLNASMAHFLTLKDSAALYDGVMSLWGQYRDLLSLNVAEVRYEDLIADPRAALGDVMSLLELSWEEGQSDHVAHAQARGSIRTPSYGQVTQPLYDRAADRWRRYETHLDGILPRLAPFVRDFGYD
ncbi:MAG: tetratricopeptide repeat protein [Rhodobiaceae bacterium]|nr:tetratricopeptide repeat protein [Rhodobiaceae bacterium]